MSNSTALFAFSAIHSLSFLFSAVFGFSLFFLCSNYSKKAPLPPGPKPIPIIGNLHQIPKHDQSRTYTEWAKHYGDVVYMHIFGREFVILNSLEATFDLFEKRSWKYSTRPRLVMGIELSGRERTSILFTKYGQNFKQCRKLMHGWINSKTTIECWPVLESCSIELLKDLMRSPEYFSEHIRRTLGSSMLKLTYGIDTLPANDPYIAMAQELSKITALATEPGRWLVDSFPILAYVPAWFPGAKFKRWAKIARKKSENLSRTPYNLVKEQVTQGKVNGSWTACQIMMTGQSETVPEDLLIRTATSVYSGAIEPSLSLLRTFFLMMARYPDVQKKAQAEIDSIVGSNSLPGLKDKDSLPYVDCLIKECFRINPIIPLIPHSLDEDDVYRGWRIPKGSWMMANMRAILHDPKAYENPTEFRPERFENNFNDGTPERDPLGPSFGFGRRFCPGYHLAVSFIFLYITRILACFDINPILDDRGVPRLPKLEFDVAHFSAPRAFEVKITPRDRDKINLISSLFTEVGVASA